MVLEPFSGVLGKFRSGRWQLFHKDGKVTWHKSNEIRMSQEDSLQKAKNQRKIMSNKEEIQNQVADLIKKYEGLSRIGQAKPVDVVINTFFRFFTDSFI